MTIYDVNSKTLQCCPRFLLNQRWKGFHYVRQLHSSMSPSEVVQAMQFAWCRCRWVGFETYIVVLLSVDDQDFGGMAVIRFRCASRWIEKFDGSHEGGRWNTTQWLPPRSNVFVFTMNVRGHRHHQYRNIRNRWYPPPPTPPPQPRRVAVAGAVERRNRRRGGGGCRGRGGGG